MFYLIHCLETLSPYSKEHGGSLVLEHISFVEGRGNLIVSYPAALPARGPTHVLYTENVCDGVQRFYHLLAHILTLYLLTQTIGALIHSLSKKLKTTQYLSVVE